MLFDFHTAKVDYDPQFDLLSIRRQDCKVSYSLRFGSVAIDFHKNQPVGFEFADAEAFLKKLFNYPKLSKHLLSQTTIGKIGFAETRGNLIAFLVFVLPGKQQLEAKYVLPQVARQELKVRA